jgi:hypothetical protein
MTRRVIDNTNTLVALERVQHELHELNNTDAMLCEQIADWPPPDRHAAARSIANITREVSIMLYQLSGYMQ